MAGVRLCLMNSVVNQASRCSDDITNTQFRVKHFQSLVHSRCYMSKPRSVLSQNCLKNNRSMSLHSLKPTYPVSASRVSRMYTSFFGSKEEHDVRESKVLIPLVTNQSNVHSTDAGGSDWSASSKKASHSTEDAIGESKVLIPLVANQSNVHSTDAGGSDWSASSKKASQSTEDAIVYAREKTEAASIIRVTGTLLALLVVSMVFTKLYKHYYSSKWKYFWGALEEPVLYLVTFMAFSYFGSIIVPTNITFQNITKAWKVAAALSFVWFIHTLKTDFLSFYMDFRNIIGFDRERLLVLNKLSSVCLFTMGLMVLSKPCHLSFVHLCIRELMAFDAKYYVGVNSFLLIVAIEGFSIFDNESRWMVYRRQKRNARLAAQEQNVASK